MSEQRRARLVTRHLLDGSATSAVEAAGAVVGLHASDPATVFLSVLARGSELDIEGILAEMYDARSLIRLMGMRRTLFVVPTDTATVVHHAAALDVAAAARRRLLKQLADGPMDPPLPTDVGGWLSGLEAEVEAYVESAGPVDGAAIGEAVPGLRTAFLPRTDKPYDVRRTVVSTVLTLMAVEGRLVRGRPLGSWTSRRHTWEVAARWWPQGIPDLDRDEARRQLVERYLRAFGPATETDVAWWTGWPLGVTRAALGSLRAAPLGDGLVMADDVDPLPTPAPGAALLPALDPTPMGWKQRGWFQPEDTTGLYDRNGNIGPTVWWAGEIVGVWTVRGDGTVATRLLADRGRAAGTAVTDQASRLQQRLGGRTVTPSFRTPLERELSQA
jgi:hypothetical protein